uniref:5-methyltetrahydropteroyltriglutamate--homocysteine S-methyltransferase n=1 Tax=Chromera velia CCMP2878 TaxID=1169474 RepID=A0A0G4ICA8_9ALVE|eukprot:Cvel_13093.t1-p1 / transcript=Cvel_13093.t1 / gene=Cvel_13093 / organism=Chromera_velia_CCMP2878 / gene_product=none, putative / transcript_product=none, putative / location=Cvel_scaffold882:18952-22582(+) / protein_length=782 / sequence_SO=supercontig / SO=protein_coding / is_pseudo=false
MKTACEAFWAKKIPLKELLSISGQVHTTSLKDQLDAGVQYVGTGLHSLYDHVLDWTLRFGFIPDRFLPHASHASRDELRFLMARGSSGETALDMTKWYDTNYHNMTPEINASVLSRSATYTDLSDYVNLLKNAVSVAGSPARIAADVLGPVSFLERSSLDGVSFEEVLDSLLPVYKQTVEAIAALGVKRVHLHEPALVLARIAEHKWMRRAAERALADIKETASAMGLEMEIVLLTYYDDLTDSWDWISQLPVDGFGLDMTRGSNVDLIVKGQFPKDKSLVLGLIDGRSVWVDQNAIEMLEFVKSQPSMDRCKIVVGPSCPLLHLPIDLASEITEENRDAASKGSEAFVSCLSKATGLPEETAAGLRFARQKLKDLVQLAGASSAKAGQHAKVASLSKDEQKEVEAVGDVRRTTPYAERRLLQLNTLQSVVLPTSTIGSFPQTAEMRKERLKFRKGELSVSEYETKVDASIRECVEKQEALGLDVLVHGEPERSDMVEFFAEKMDGWLFTKKGWVQSYGSRYVRPPIVVGDIKRKGDAPMTVREFKVAQACTDKPVKGMLTGPTTILAWSFPRADISRAAQAFQIGRALRDEIADLQKAGCSVVQVDEPALRETLPLKKNRQAAYLLWATRAFRLSTVSAKPETHIVTHFCYSDFGEIADAIADLDADQVTIENSRSGMAMLKELRDCGAFARDFAPGVYDVHSPAIPSVETIAERLRLYLQEGAGGEGQKGSRVWVVPDCGLKTRKWDEVEPQLRNMVKAARLVRTEAAAAATNGKKSAVA